jgi:hypothetical protein
MGTPAPATVRITPPMEPVSAKTPAAETNKQTIDRLIVSLHTFTYPPYVSRRGCFPRKRIPTVPHPPALEY